MDFIENPSIGDDFVAISICDGIVANDELTEIDAIRGWLYQEAMLYCIHTNQGSNPNEHT